MARYIEQGESIFIPFQHGVSMSDSQLHLRMYKTPEAFERHCPKGGGERELFEYAPIVRCKDCLYYEETVGKDSGKPCGYGRCAVPCHWITGIVYDEDFCSYGERKEDGKEQLR